MVKMIVPKEERRDQILLRPINRSPVNTNAIEALTPESDKKVQGTFINIECPGQPARISCRLYRGMAYFNETFEDSKQYTIPLSVARFINERCKHEVHSYLQDEAGNPIKTGKYTARYKFMIESMAA